MGQPIVASITLATADDDGIAQSQSPGAAGNLTLNGALVSGGVAALTSAGAARQVIITSGGNDSTRIFTIYGTDESGIPQSEALAGAAVGIATSVLYYRSVTRVAISAASAGTVKAGTNGVGVTRWANYNIHAQPFNVTNACAVTGTVNYTLQYTYDPLNSIGKVWNSTSVAGFTADSESSFLLPITGSRVLLNSGTGTVQLTAIQAGIVGG